MEFGRVPENELNRIDFSLPAEPAFNKKILKGKPAKDPKIYLGCAKWGRMEWVGKIYPPGTKEKDFLALYARHYNSVELNATHYKIYGPNATTKWAEKVKGKDFLFCPKMYQGVTHRGKLLGKEWIMTEFMRGIHSFGEHLGPVFIQTQENFTPKRVKELLTFLSNLPKTPKFFLELRHPDWYERPNLEIIATELKKLKIGMVITDTAGRRDVAHMHLATPATWIRYVGNSLHPTDYTRIDAWVKRIKYWLGHGLRELYFFMHMHEEATSPELTVYLVDKLNKACGLELKKPVFIGESS